METYPFHLFETANKYYLSTRANPVSMIAAEKENLSQDKANIEDFIDSYMYKAIPSALSLSLSNRARFFRYRQSDSHNSFHRLLSLKFQVWFC